MKEKKVIIIVAGVAVAAFVAVLLFAFLCPETVDYYSAVNKNTVRDYVKFRDKYPESKYMDDLNEHKSLLEERYFSDRKKKNTLEAYDEFLYAFPHDKYTAEATRLRDSIIYWQSEIEKYGKNSLENGSVPYESHFGKPKPHKKDSNSDIIVKAPLSFDMVAIVRQNDENGEVVAHAYVKADSTYTFTVDNGRYQTFFYIGRGWHPEKKVSNDLIGGFLLSETYSKDDPTTVNDEVISYKISMRQKKYSTKREVLGE